MVVGFDTSAYTTSVALAEPGQGVIGDYRQLLQVKPGQRGLRQADAVFDHIRNLPDLIARASTHFSADEVIAVGASVTPTPAPNSYMPVFVPGSSWAKSLASTLKVPLYNFSHQEGHIRAALSEANLDQSKPFLAVHFSGGTSEIMLVNRQSPGNYQIQVCGRGSDLAAGQLVDRVGVKLGLSFPAGAELERLALMADNDIKEIPVLPSSVNARCFSFSGAEAEAFRQIERGTPPALVAQAVLRCIANTLEKVIRASSEQYSVRQVLLAGGVMANQIIKSRLEYRLSEKHWYLGFALPELATDNATGIALLTLERQLGKTL
ncbi:MAG: peptidase M22 [Methylocystaceae bacterium]